MKNFEGYRISFLNTIDSTSNEAKRWVDKGLNGNKFVLWADYQDAGKGQQGNHWESEDKKNLLFTLCIQPTDLPVKNQFYLSMANALAVWQTLNDIQPGFLIKWPNDIYYQNKKISGTLIENTLKKDHIAQSFIGVGININQEHFTSNAPNPVSLWQITGKTYNREEILKSYIKNFKTYYRLLETGQTEFLRQQYLSHLFQFGEFFTYKDKEGLFQAKITDVTFDGRLHLIDKKNIEKAYYFKEVKYILHTQEYE